MPPHVATMLKSLALVVIVATIWTVFGQSARLDNPSAWQERGDQALTLSVANPVRQSFVSNRDYLSAVSIKMDMPAGVSSHSVVAHLFEVGSTNHEVASGELVAGTSEDTGYNFFAFAALPHSNGMRYVISLEYASPSALPPTIWASSQDEYSDGQAEQGDHPLSGDLTFKTYCEYPITRFVSDIVDALITHPQRILAGVALFLLPGMAMLAVLPGAMFAGTLGVRLGLSVGISIALMPIALTLATGTGNYITPLLLEVGLGACAILVGLRALHAAFRKRRLTFHMWDMAALALVAAVLGIDFAATREVSFPLWTDSYHHTVIAQLIREHGQIPSDYSPYYPLPQFTYHFGFHALAAFYAQLADTDSALSVVIVGQIVNAVTGITLYGAAYQLTRSGRVAFLAAAVALLVNHIPALYVNWGRYTQLTGQTVLPVLTLAMSRALTVRRHASWWCALTAVLSAGMFLIHYRVALFGVFAALSLMIVHSRRLARNRSAILRTVYRALSIAGVAAVFALPWLWRIAQLYMSDRFLPNVTAQSTDVIKQINVEASGIATYFNFQPSMVVDFGANVLVLLLAASGIFAGWPRHRGLVVGLMLWLVMLVLGANAYRLHIDVYSITIAIIAVYLPVAVLAALALDGLWRALVMWIRHQQAAQGWHKAIPIIGATGTAAILTVCGLQRIGIVRWENEFVRSADLQAIEWVRLNTPPDAKFLVSGFFWQPTSVEGRDAGWWLPLLAHRAANVPLELYVSDGLPQYIIDVNRLARAADNLRDPARSIELLHAAGIRYVFIGSRPSALDPTKLLDTTGYMPAFHRDGAWVFEVQ